MTARNKKKAMTNNFEFRPLLFEKNSIELLFWIRLSIECLVPLLGYFIIKL